MRRLLTWSLSDVLIPLGLLLLDGTTGMKMLLLLLLAMVGTFRFLVSFLAS
jgi:hypothetical protein